ncbi:MAG: hypothetical protein ABI790_00415 [Betaproteobacteria bacterium]
MKRFIENTSTQNGALAIALIVLLAGCGFALVQAFGGAEISSSLITVPFVTT